MNSKTTKIFLVLILITSMIMGGAYFYIQKRINPASLKSEINAYVTDNYPNLDLKINEIEVSLGLTTDISLKRILLKNKGSEVPTDLFSLENCEIKVPLLNILTGGGTIKVIMDKPVLSYVLKNKINNWEEGLKKKAAAKAVNSKAKAEAGKNKSLPAFLANSQLNAQFINLEILHRDAEKQNIFEFDKVQLNDIGVKRPTAFNLISRIKIGKESNYQFDLKSVGELNLRAFLEDKVIQVRAQSKINNVIVNKKTVLQEELVADSKINIRKNNSGTIETELKIDEVLDSKLKILLLKDKSNLEVKEFRMSLESIFKMADLKVPSLGLGDSWIEVKGGLTVGTKNTLTPNLLVNITKPLSYDFNGNFIGIDRLDLSLIDSEFSLETSMNALKGRIDLRAGNTIDINKPIDMKELDVFEASLVLNGIEINKSLIPESDKEANSKKTKPALVLPLKLSVELKNILLFNEVINGSGEVLAVKKMLALKQFKIRHKKGNFSFDSTTKDLDSNPNHSFNIDTDNLDMTLLNGFMEKETPRITGIMNASIVGKVKTVKKEMRYDAFLKGKVNNGELKGYDLSSMVNSYVKKINGYPYFSKKPIKEVKISQNFELISFDIHAKSDQAKIKKSRFIGIDKKIEVRTQGSLRPKGKSELYLNIFDKKQKTLKFLKEVDMKQFPVKLSGTGYELKPDHKYTLKFVQKKAEKRIKRKAKAKAKKVIKKELKKLEEKVLKGKKAKDLLKDIFK